MRHIHGKVFAGRRLLLSSFQKVEPTENVGEPECGNIGTIIYG